MRVAKRIERYVIDARILGFIIIPKSRQQPLAHTKLCQLQGVWVSTPD